MPNTHDVVFGKTAIAQKVITAAQGNLAVKVQNVVKRYALSKNVADILIEGGQLTRPQAENVLQIMHRSGVTRHPELVAHTANPLEESGMREALQLGKVPDALRAECEKLALELEALGYSRT